MEMQQIRYFLSLAETLNFTRAAEECNVSQPALTRAIQALEGELGGELLRREGKRSHLTELGRRMLPLMQRCYESAMSARELARAVVKNEISPLTIAISNSVNLELFMHPVSELFRSFSGLQLKIGHDAAAETLKELKEGKIDLAIAGNVEDGWDRLDRWPLFNEQFELSMRADHPLARANEISLADLRGATIFKQTGCEDRPTMSNWFAEHGAALDAAHEFDSHHDLGALLQASDGIAIVPMSAPVQSGVARAKLQGLDIQRAVYAYAVAGRRRSPPAAAFLGLLRSAEYPAEFVWIAGRNMEPAL